jgi:hypothetical protein
LVDALCADMHSRGCGHQLQLAVVIGVAQAFGTWKLQRTCEPRQSCSVCYRS